MKAKPQKLVFLARNTCDPYTTRFHDYVAPQCSRAAWDTATRARPRVRVVTQRTGTLKKPHRPAVTFFRQGVVEAKPAMKPARNATIVDTFVETRARRRPHRRAPPLAERSARPEQRRVHTPEGKERIIYMCPNVELVIVFRFRAVQSRARCACGGGCVVAIAHTISLELWQALCCTALHDSPIGKPASSRVSVMWRSGQRWSPTGCDLSPARAAVCPGAPPSGRAGVM
jgi:hypothetical protein